MVRILSIVGAIAAVICFIVALIINATTNPTSVQHWEIFGGIFLAVSLGLFELSTVVEKPLP